MHDVVIRGGTIVDGSGGDAVEGDVAIDGGRIAEVGKVDGGGKRTIDATGLLVTPGFVDIHTHYDGQVTWDPLLTPSFWHGVTTVVMGNCGVGFAPVAPGKRQWLIGLMEGVEDIPGTALSEGIDWQWETFPEYLSAIEKIPHALDIGTQIPHGAVRGYVMGDRGARNEPASPEDIEKMRVIVREAIEAGALGFSTSRTIVHRAIDGEPVPGTFAAEDELFGIGQALADAGAGLFELAPAGAMGEDLAAPEKEMAWMRKLSAAIGRPVTFALAQNDSDKDQWRRMLDLAQEAIADGADIKPQVGSRPTSLLMGLQTFHPFSYRATYQAMADLPLAERVAKLRDPETKARILAEKDNFDDERIAFLIEIIFSGLDRTYLLGDPPNYEPGPERSIAHLAKVANRDPYDLIYDRLLDRDGREFIMRAILSYSDGDLEAIRGMLEHPTSAFGLGDGGAHCAAICDASMTTSLLSHWTRDRTRGPKLALPWAIRKMTRDTAALYGLNDRGLLQPGKKADVNLIDYDKIGLLPPEMVHDLPAGAGRLIQRATGYVATLVSGEVISENGEETGARPGKLIRGARN